MNSGGQTIYGEPIDLDFPNIGLENDKKMIFQTIHCIEIMNCLLT